MNPPDSGVFDALRRAAGTLMAMLQSRLELASLELGEAGQRLFLAAALGLFGVLLLGAAVVMASVWLVMLSWPTLGPAALLVCAGAYLLTGLGLLAWVRAHLRKQPALLSATLSELQRDAALLRTGPQPTDR